MSELAIYSRVPPPFGGVTVHVSRLLAALQAAGIPVRVHDMDGRSDPDRGVVPAAGGAAGLLRFAAHVREPVVALHTSSLPALIAAVTALQARGRAVVPMLHSMAPVRAFDRLPPLGRAAAAAALGRARGFICVNDALAAWVRGPLRHRGPHVAVLPAFLPPAPRERDPAALPPPLRRFAADHPLLLSSQGFFGYFVGGRHVYGFEDLGAVLATLRAGDPRWGLVTLRTDTYDEGHRAAILALRRRLGLDEHWLVVEEPVAGPAVWSLSRAFLRPTATDGDSVSVREALLLGVPVVASDAVPRPPGCWLHPVGDVEAMRSHVERAVAGELAPPAPGPTAAPVRDTAPDYVRFWRDVLATI